MNRSLLLSLIVLSACSRRESRVTAVTPYSHDQAISLRNLIQSGHAPLPDDAIPPATSCADFVSQLHDFTPGTIEVPEDWDHPDQSPKIQVFYYWRKPENADADRPPVVFFNGGPASDSHGSAKLLGDLAFTQEQPFVFVDQRGTGCSSSFPTDLTEANAQRLTNWGSRGIVGDAEALRKTLFGDRKWRAYGQSYGGFIVHRYLEIAPEGLDRAIAHGASVMQDPISWMVERVRSQQRVGTTYFKSFPGDRDILEMARAAIPPAKCWESGSDSVCGPAVLDSLTILLGFRDNWPSLHRWILKLKDGNGTLDQAAVDSLVKSFVFGVYGEGGLAGNVISKMEIAPGFDDQTGCRATLERLRKAGENPDAWPINECRLLLSYQSPFADLMKNISARPISLERVLENLTRGPVSFYLFSGRQDVFVPFATFDEEVKKLGKAVHYESFPSSGHEGFYTEAHVTDAVTGN
jgi:pimeloyl-ACP methyl ester carboxylesterase